MKKVLLSFLVLLPLQTFADTEYSSYYNQCMEDSEGITANMLDCNGIETQYQDDRLNKVYKKLQQKLSPSEKLKLRDEQRAWIKSRDRKVDQVYRTQSGTMANLEGSSLYLELTTKQADKLERRLN